MKRTYLLVSVVVFACCTAGRCSDSVPTPSENLCGPCGSVAAGDAFITGDARIDGLFRAVGTIGSATATIEVVLREELLALADAFDVEVVDDMSIEDLAAEVRDAIDAELAAKVDGGLEVDFVPPTCRAAVDVAVAAQAHCEAQAGCDVSAECEAGEVSFGCEGTCVGQCSGECQGGCTVEAGGGCDGTCTGACQLDAGGACEGICRGSCNGSCSLQTPDGNCEGTCDGECIGSCELKAGGGCNGTCHGECEVEVAAECAGECRGGCSGECTGECVGNVTPPSCSVEGECAATADCQASAKAQGSAALECTPPTLTFRYDFKPEVDADARAELVARMAALKVHLMGIVQGLFQLRALVDTTYAAEHGIDSPLVLITGQIQSLAHADLDSFDIPPGRFDCLIPAIEETGEILADLTTGLAGTLMAQWEIVSVIGIH